jgi:hypothetical protein
VGWPSRGVILQPRALRVLSLPRNLVKLCCTDLFVPKQLRFGCCLGLECPLPVLTVRRCPRSSAVVRRRCRAVRHSPGSRCGTRARQLSSPGAGITLPGWQINSGCPGQSGVGVVTCGWRLSALVGLGRPRDSPGLSQPSADCVQVAAPSPVIPSALERPAAVPCRAM